MCILYTHTYIYIYAFFKAFHLRLRPRNSGWSEIMRNVTDLQAVCWDIQGDFPVKTFLGFTNFFQGLCCCFIGPQWRWRMQFDNFGLLGSTRNDVRNCQLFPVRKMLRVFGVIFHFWSLPLVFFLLFSPSMFESWKTRRPRGSKDTTHHQSLQQWAHGSIH